MAPLKIFCHRAFRVMFGQMLQIVWANGAKLNIIQICVNMKPRKTENMTLRKQWEISLGGKEFLIEKFY